jgi:uncharacterized protein (DUF433 family)
MSPIGCDGITADPAVLAGKPVVRGPRLVVECSSSSPVGGDATIVVANYSGLTVEDIRPALPTRRTSSPRSGCSRRRTDEHGRLVGEGVWVNT